MSENTNYIKIRVNLMNYGPIQLTSTGIKWDDDFHDRVYDKEELFRSLILIPINESVGLDNWAIRFMPAIEDINFFVDIYAPNEEDAFTISSIVKHNITDVEFNFRYEGNISKYIGKKH